MNRWLTVLALATSMAMAGCSVATTGESASATGKVRAGKRRLRRRNARTSADLTRQRGRAGALTSCTTLTGERRGLRGESTAGPAGRAGAGVESWPTRHGSRRGPRGSDSARAGQAGAARSASRSRERARA